MPVWWQEYRPSRNNIADGHYTLTADEILGCLAQEPIIEPELEPEVEYEVIMEFETEPRYKSVGSFTDLNDAFDCIKEHFAEHEPGLKRIFIDKVDMESLENEEFLELKIL